MRHCPSTFELMTIPSRYQQDQRRCQPRIPFPFVLCFFRVRIELTRSVLFSRARTETLRPKSLSCAGSSSARGSGCLWGHPSATRLNCKPPRSSRTSRSKIFFSQKQCFVVMEEWIEIENLFMPSFSCPAFHAQFHAQRLPVSQYSYSRLKWMSKFWDPVELEEILQTKICSKQSSKGDGDHNHKPLLVPFEEARKKEGRAEKVLERGFCSYATWETMLMLCVILVFCCT